MSSRGEEGPCEYLVISPGNKNPKAKVLAWDHVFCLSHSLRAVGQPALPWGQQGKAQKAKDKWSEPDAGLQILPKHLQVLGRLKALCCHD